MFFFVDGFLSNIRVYYYQYDGRIGKYSQLEYVFVIQKYIKAEDKVFFFFSFEEIQEDEEEDTQSFLAYVSI